MFQLQKAHHKPSQSFLLLEVLVISTFFCVWAKTSLLICTPCPGSVFWRPAHLGQLPLCPDLLESTNVLHHI